MHPKIAGICVFAIAVAFSGHSFGADPSPSTTFDPKVYNARTAEQRLAFALAMIDKHDASLLNFSFKMQMRLKGSNAIDETTYEVRRLDHEWWRNTTVFAPGIG